MKKMIRIISFILVLVMAFSVAAYAENETETTEEAPVTQNGRQGNQNPRMKGNGRGFGQKGFGQAGRGGKGFYGAAGIVREDDVDALLEAGIIDQETADKIKEYATSKQEEFNATLEGFDEMTPEERTEAFAGFKDGRFKGSCMDGLMDALVEAGVLTQEQADAVAESMNK